MRRAKPKMKAVPVLEKAMESLDDGIKQVFGLREFVVTNTDVKILDEKSLKLQVTLTIEPNPLVVMMGRKKP